MQRGWWVIGALALLGCSEITAPLRRQGYEWRLLLGAPGGGVDTLAFRWEAEELPVRFWVQDTLDLRRRTTDAIAAWRAQVLYGEVSGVLVSDSTGADVLVFGRSAPGGGIAGLRLERARGCQGATDVDIDVPARLVTLPMRVYVQPFLSSPTEELERCLDITTTHEVGHALGIFTHAPGAEELMNADPEVAGPSELDRATIERMSHAQRTLRPVRSR